MSNLRQLLANKYFRLVTIVVIIGATFGIFGYYLVTHPEVLQSVVNLNISTILLLTLAYLVTILANAFVLRSSLLLLKTKVPYAENIALTGYSSVVNFFGPLQSGPGFRAAYLKKKHGVSLKSFFYVTVIFYGFFAAINTLIIAVAILLQASISFVLAMTAGAATALIVLWFTLPKNPRVVSILKTVQLTNKNFWFIGLGALILSLATAAAYFIELTHVDSAITIGQSIVYAAAANLALFVSLTPGAIGFRESFLLLSQQLHGIATNTVIAASIIDRAFYVVFLLVLFVCLLLFGVSSKLRKVR